MTTEAPAALRADACPDPGQLAAYLDGTLGPDERTLVERHLLECAECREIVGGTVAFQDEHAPAVVPRPSRTTWVVLGTVLAAAAAIVLVVRSGRDVEVDWTPMLTAQGGSRPIEARLSIMSSYAPPPAPLRAGASDRELSVDARIAAVKIQQRAEAHRNASTLHDAGVARLLTGDVDGAVQSLQDAADNAPSTALFADLSAALLSAGARRNDAAQVRRARDAAGRAVQLDPSYPPALFNAALAAELVGPPAQAIAAWDHYLALDTRSQWANEAREHLDRLRQGR
jgi:hypothetical protein